VSDNDHSDKPSSVPPTQGLVEAPPPSQPKGALSRSTESAVDIHSSSSSYPSSQALSHRSTEDAIVTPSPLSLPPSQALSRQSTESTILSSSSSFSAGSQALSHQSTENVIDVPSSSVDQKLGRILTAVQDVASVCRVCWVHGGKTRPHRTFKCPTKICSSQEWGQFKINLRFPKNSVCYFCLSPYAPPFNHARPPPGTEKSADLCEYPDVLKELVYIIYQDRSRRSKIFAKLGVAPPSSLYLYQRFIGKRQQDGILGAYEVVNAYLELRESEEFKLVA